MLSQHFISVVKGGQAGAIRCALALLLALALTSPLMGAAKAPDGGKIYRQLCVECHGAKGQGVADKYDEPLFGDRSLESLARLIERTMPEDKPKHCVGEDAKAVAAYIFDTFYSPQARSRNNPAQIDLVRLTNRQYRESVADLVGSFGAGKRAAKHGGLKAEYFQSKGMNKKDKSIQNRVDGRIDFDYGTNSPVEGIAPDQFSIAWNGSLLAPYTGEYHFRITTPNGARLYLNSDLREGDSNRRDDSSDRRQPALIDMWVASGAEPRVLGGSLFLLGGRSYPMRLDYFKFKDKTASVRLEWKPPHGVWSVLDEGHLSPEFSSSVTVVSTDFPPDDGSTGYERGTAISKGWHDATTKAAVEVANAVAGRVGSLSGSSERDNDRLGKIKSFCGKFVERAFRRPLTPELQRAFVDAQFEPDAPVEISVKKVVMLTLKSPRFLYPELGGSVDDYTVATRLALALWDSVPDAPLLEAAAKGGLRTGEQTLEQARRMMADPRAKAKLKGFFDHWLAIEEAEDISKDADEYPGFGDAFISDLRVSLERFVEKVVWSEASDYRELLLADYLYLNPRLAKFYGAEAPTEDVFQEIKFDPAQRAGIFTHPFLLSAFAYHKSSSPIHRGVFLTRNILGRFLKPPPMAIEFMDDRFDPSLTMREKVTELTKKESCMGCHVTINPLGFSLEHYDAAGRYRTHDNKKPIDSESDYTTPEGEVIRLRGARDVATHAAGNEDARLGFVRQMFHHLIKQTPAAYGPDTLRKLEAKFNQSGHHMRNLMIEISTVAALHGRDPQLAHTKNQP